MSKKIVTYVLTLAMIFSVISNPALGYATTEADASAVTNTTATKEVNSDVSNTDTEKSTNVAETVSPAPVVAKVMPVKAEPVSCKTVKVTWKKVAGAKGYQVYRYDKKTKQYTRYITTKKLYLKNSKLAANTTYSYKIRAYKVQNGKTYYGPFSKAVKCKTEKTDRMKVGQLAYSKIGSAYKSGAKGPKCFDCSGFVQWVYKNADIDPKTKLKGASSASMYSAMKKYKIGSSIKSLKKAKMGDLIFFKYGGKISHVGIYYKDGKMIHAANPKKDVCMESVSKYNRCGFKVVGIISILD